MKRLLSTFFFILISNFLLAQSSEIEVADLSVKVPGLGFQEYFYGFEEGDELIFTFSENNKKEVKQLEIIEYPNTIKFSGTQISNTSKRFKINKRGVYIFKFTNSAIGQRICSFKIARIPANASTSSFNTSITWKQITDTTFTTITKQEITRYDTTFKYLAKKELIKIDTIAQELFSKNEQIAAGTTIGKPSESILTITLPTNQISSLESKEVISWAYWIGVGQEGHIAFESNKKKYLQAAGSLADITGNPLIGLALNQVAFLPTGNAGSNVGYYFLPTLNDAQIFIRSFDNGGFRYFDKGNGVSGYGRKDIPLQGTFYLGLHNDNFHNEINVTVKVVAVSVYKKYIERQIKEPVITPQYVNKTIKEPTVTIKRIPVNMN
ncbi:hypothetical protein I5M27_17935 [Adhaeribacter sp. BT258]|uniref:Uncharacterized protein n=1 Tax=Adhaeribacter terrigena TaxID=2793070 RepID=A0ABS1C671_9BACT|nr:hypothetical protein [Adhaeribacter terrigena]MBK0404877.1 hypothetical protein [Adhaeribacter terrigena]